MLSGEATIQTPPDLPSYLFKERIVYLVRARPRVCLLGVCIMCPCVLGRRQQLLAVAAWWAWRARWSLLS